MQRLSLNFARLALATLLGVAAVSAAQADGKPCNLAADVAKLANPLPNVSAHLAAGLPIKVVALGSSSTAGAGASSTANNYPSRLEVELKQRFPGHDFTVVNRGVNGDEARDMLARFDSVASEKPDLIIWQAGTNAVLRDTPLASTSTLLHDGVQRMKSLGADVILMDAQYAPKVLAKADIDGMIALLANTAKQENVQVFRRFALMRRWKDTEGMSFDEFISADGLHMNDWSYGCVAKVLGAAIAEAATRPVVTVSATARFH